MIILERPEKKRNIWKLAYLKNNRFESISLRESHWIEKGRNIRYMYCTIYIVVNVLESTFCIRYIYIEYIYICIH